MAIMFVRAQVIGRGAGRSIVSAAAYRHRARMMDEQAGTSFSYRGGANELVHEELALPNEIPAWLKSAVEGKSVAKASEIFWNAVDASEKRADAQLARELIIALPEELTRAENIALVQEFVQDNLTAKGMIADWVYHDKDGNPHIHLMTALRPLAEEGFGPKKVPILGEDGEQLRVVTPDRPNGRIVYTLWAGDKETMKAWKTAWADTANRHLALAGHEIRLDGRSYAEQGLDGIAQKHLGPEKAALARKGIEMFFAPGDLARRQEMADRLLAEPQLLLKQLANERSTFDEKDIARALHRYVDDPVDFTNIRSQLMASDDLVLLKAQRVDTETGKVAEPAVFTTREILRIEYDMAQSANALSKRSGFAISEKATAAAISQIETQDPQKPFQLDPEQIDAVRHVTGDNGIAAVIGLAGAGKSTLLAAARLAWESPGSRVVGAALAGKAAEGLEESSGIKSRTLASLEMAWVGGRDLLESGDVLVIDEAGMISSQQMARVLKVAEDAGAKVVLVGDAMQLQPIQAGAAFRVISDRIGFAELAGVRRQRDEWAREASRLFAHGEVEKGLDIYARQGRLAEAETRTEIINRIVEDWTDARRDLLHKAENEETARQLRGDELLVLAHTNEDVKRLNASLRQVMAEEGALTGACEFQTERGAREFAVSDRIIFLENARFVEQRARHFGPQYVKNGMLGTVISTGDKRGGTLLRVRLDNGREVVISEDSYRNIDHGYAATIHKSQGVTVDRTFVLASGMMDQHLTYVSMTRHRDRADLYAAREDFEPRPEWGRKPRVDHATGVAGELVEIGEAKFRPEDEDAKESPYADVKTDDGAVHRLWGVSLPKALGESGVRKGDTVTLRKDGVEQVKVEVTVVDEQTGEKRIEERQVERNVWVAGLQETAHAREQRLERESHRPELFTQLVARLSRSGAKTTTLDFESEEGYRAHVQDFAWRRGIDTLAAITTGMQENVSGRLAWIGKKRTHIAKLWERASVALGFAIERERGVTYSETGNKTYAVEISTAGKYLIAPASIFARSIDEDARRAQLRSDRWKERNEILRPVLERIYRDADGALARLNVLASDARTEPRQLADNLLTRPQRLGCLHGSDRFVDGRAGREDQNAALGALSELVPLARAHATEFRRQAARFGIREQQRRAHMSLSIPMLSKPAMARLIEIETIRERGGGDAYKTAFRYVVEDRQLVQEVKAVNDALTARFGWSAFTKKADVVAERHMTERMPENISPEHREKLMRLFNVVRRFSAEQHLAEKQDRSRIVAGASIQNHKEIMPMLPMLAAVTEFKTSVEEEARRRAIDVTLYRDHRAALTETATLIWRDPAGAVAKVEELVMKGFGGERVAAALSNDPTAYGALRGSDRLMDRLFAAGRERKEAVQAVPEVASRVRSLGASWATALDVETQAVIEERRRMAVAIPGLSRAAENALSQLVNKRNERRQRGNKRQVSLNSLDPRIAREFVVVSRALDERFGWGAILRGEKDVANHIAPSQHRAFQVMRERLQVLQQAVRTERSLEIIAVHQQHRVDRGRGVVR
ncbi:Ti-type conjugative transfer relaxase TraA [Brucella sp. NM4]|uniref:Ti-type conjugative transfer relaxase TraA n=1 Tax=Brucella/Ochrobactrum group TaxID=2826938 RepID=UPI0024BD1A91|nr:Ti-type conjugative transfer relaxase TraA [Brucella sp. NM4]WHS30400.1 Ti-type conjugative transfer relaxase TraA [Brucella sp. NM4]WHT45258.1 Ti-type conjugative transfer relaxase TraA [Ochrobactrum sp. SSR]